MRTFNFQSNQLVNRQAQRGQVATIRHRSWMTHLALGLATGLGLGIVARSFMRLLAEDPEFTWSGTLFIVGLFTAFGVVQELVAAIRGRTSRLWITVPIRVIGGLSYLVLAAGAGVLLLPFLWLGGLAMWRTSWHRRVRAALAILASADMLAVLVFTLTDEGFDRLYHPSFVAGFALLVMTYIAIVWRVGPTLSGGPKRPARIGE